MANALLTEVTGYDPTKNLSGVWDWVLHNPAPVLVAIIVVAGLVIGSRFVRSG